MSEAHAGPVGRRGIGTWLPRITVLLLVAAFCALPGCIARPAGSASEDPFEVTATQTGRNGGGLTPDTDGGPTGVGSGSSSGSTSTQDTTTDDPSTTDPTVTVTETETETTTRTATSTSASTSSSTTTDPSTSTTEPSTSTTQPSSTTTTTSTSTSTTTTTTDSSTTTTDSTTSAPPPPPPPPPPPNVAPEASLTSNGQSGPAPYELSFVLSGFDANGDALTWVFQPEGPGGPQSTGTDADFPATVTHTYSTAGNYPATLTVSDGSLTGTATVDVAVT